MLIEVFLNSWVQRSVVRVSMVTEERLFLLQIILLSAEINLLYLYYYRSTIFAIISIWLSTLLIKNLKTDIIFIQSMLDR